MSSYQILMFFSIQKQLNTEMLLKNIVGILPLSWRSEQEVLKGQSLMQWGIFFFFQMHLLNFLSNSFAFVFFFIWP